MKTLLILIITATLALPLSAQVSQQWAKRYNSTGTVNDYASALTYDAAGNVYVTGRGNNNYVTIKYSPTGDQLWLKSYTGPVNDSDIPSDIHVDAAGNVYVTGTGFGTGTGNDFATVKYDSDGNELWVQRFNGTNNDEDEAIGLSVDAAGNVYVAGSSSNAGNESDYTLVKYSSAGSQLWVRYYNGPGDGADYASGMEQDAAGNIYITGKSRGGASGNDYATVKFSSSGTLLWSVRYTGTNADEPSALAVDGAGNVYVTGFSASGLDGNDYTTIKYNNAGVQQWLKRYDRTNGTDDRAVDIAVDGTGKIFVTGYCSGFGTASFDYVTLSYSSNGDQLWAKSYNGGIVGADDKASSLDVDNAGNIYVTGSSVSSGSDPDYATIKYSNSGQVLWSIMYESSISGADNPAAVHADNDGNIYVTGSSTVLAGADFLTVKYSQPIGIQNISGEVPDKFSLSQNYPNPFNPVTNIEFSIPSSANTKLTVFDISGREISLLVDQNLSAGIYKVDFDASHLSSGTYFYRLESEGYREVKKMLMVK
jgi:uncharacterized delta-60 repeat protein